VKVAQESFPGRIRILPREEALEAAREWTPGLVLWSDGSRLEDGRVGAGVAWQTLLGAWRSQETPLGRGLEVFDAELAGACRALELAIGMEDQGPVTVFMDSQAAITRLSHSRRGPGQGLAIRAATAAQALRDRGLGVTIQWVPGHEGIEGNERADQAAKRAAAKPRRGGQGELSLAYINRVRTEITGSRRQQWLTKRLSQRSAAAQRTYRAQPGWKMDPVAAAAPKGVVSRYYQLKVGHAAIGTYLRKIGKRDSEACQWCQAPSETVHHLLFECREWRRQREKLYKALKEAKVALPTAAEEHPEGRILGDPGATKPILHFLNTTRIGAPRETTALRRAQADDEWGLEALEEAESDGVG